MVWLWPGILNSHHLRPFSSNLHLHDSPTPQSNSWWPSRERLSPLLDRGRAGSCWVCGTAASFLLLTENTVPCSCGSALLSRSDPLTALQSAFDLPFPMLLRALDLLSRGSQVVVAKANCRPSNLDYALFCLEDSRNDSSHVLCLQAVTPSISLLLLSVFLGGFVVAEGAPKLVSRGTAFPIPTISDISRGRKSRNCLGRQSGTGSNELAVARVFGPQKADPAAD
ncbi:uncharacterized protein J3D65DRAFT_382318 [Phyllosticta citribraziliensis]|uniref:Peptidase C1A papain C-terminal domain-containing protein n=1 Tax=Phyllosticta citribraziliensis TaxID=989973 RepID=A0ABR1LRX4_9PEZI